MKIQLAEEATVVFLETLPGSCMGVHCAACQIREPTTADRTSMDQEQIHSTRCSVMTEPACFSADDLGSCSVIVMGCQRFTFQVPAGFRDWHTSRKLCVFFCFFWIQVSWIWKLFEVEHARKLCWDPLSFLFWSVCWCFAVPPLQIPPCWAGRRRSLCLCSSWTSYSTAPPVCLPHPPPRRHTALCSSSS